MSLPKLIMTDIDGVWTDGSMYYSENGDELKRFHTSDSAGVAYAHANQIPVAILTGEDTEIVARRAEKVGVDYVFQGVKDKVKIAQDLCAELNIELSECAYIGDDLNDFQLLKRVGTSACPSNGQKFIQEIVDIVVPVQGGSGAFRTFVEQILHDNNALTDTLKTIVDDRV